MLKRIVKIILMEMALLLALPLSARADVINDPILYYSRNDPSVLWMFIISIAVLITGVILLIYVLRGRNKVKKIILSILLGILIALALFILVLLFIDVFSY